MNKVIVVGKKGTLTNTRDEDTQDAVNLYCKNQNATKDEIIAKGLSIFTIEFNSVFCISIYFYWKKISIN